MKILKNISATMNRKFRDYRTLAEFAEALGIGKTACQEYLAGRGNPNARTIQLLADRLKVSLAELVAGETGPCGKAFDLISEMLESLHPSLCDDGELLLDMLQKLFQRSEQRWKEDFCWRYTVTEYRSFQYGLKAELRTKHGWRFVKESDSFTDDPFTARSAAELFTRNALSPIHLEEAIEDFVKSR